MGGGLRESGEEKGDLAVGPASLQPMITSGCKYYHEIIENFTLLLTPSCSPLGALAYFCQQGAAAGSLTNQI